MRKANYTKCAVICHGLSEVSIAKYIKSNLHLKLEILSKNNGHNSIQITSLLKFMSDKKFLSIKKFSDEYDIEYSKKMLIDFRLYIIMDTDDCTEEQRNKFINKDMFINHPLYEYIYPIADVPNLESVLLDAGIMAKRIKNEEKGEYYVKTFPINNEPFSMDSYKEIETFRDRIKKAKSTNMDEFLSYCLGLIK